MSSPAVPARARKIVVHTLSSDFRAATHIVTFTVDASKLKHDQVLVKNHYAGINVSRE
jgi:hypothetical protein